MLSNIQQHYDSMDETNASAQLFLRRLILDLHPDMTEEWKYRLPFFYFKGRMFCYFWQDKKSKLPYIGISDAYKMEHPALVKGDRKRIKVLPYDPSKDLDVELIESILREMMTHY